MDQSYAGIVYDLDGTLVELAADWAAVATDVIEVYDSAGVDASGADLWGLLEDAPTHGIEAEVEETISRHERAGARESRRLALADELREHQMPVGVCSLNSERACRIALETHGLAEAVDIVVGRDTAETHKPNPESLLAAVSGLGVEPSETLFVGDSPRDRTTAERAGTAFRFV